MCDMSIIHSARENAVNEKVECENIPTQETATAKKTIEYIAGGGMVNRKGISSPAVSLKNLIKSEANYGKCKQKCSKCRKCKW